MRRILAAVCLFLAPSLGAQNAAQNLPQPAPKSAPARLTFGELEGAMGATVTARKLLKEGFITVRNMGSGGGMDLALKRSIDRG